MGRRTVHGNRMRERRRIRRRGYLTRYESSDWPVRGFCSRCGTHLFYQRKKTGRYAVPVRLFNGDEDLVFAHQVFIDEKPTSNAFSNRTDTMTGPELIDRHKKHWMPGRQDP